jgi:hypothetical protein
MSDYECAVCWLCDTDLPDEVDPEMFFDNTAGITHCPTCDPTDIVQDAWEQE